MNNSLKGLILIFLALSMISYSFHFQKALSNNSSPQLFLFTTNKISQSNSMTITGNDQLAQRSVSGSGTENDPFILSNYNIKCSSTKVGSPSGITIKNTNKFFILEKIYVQHCDRGIKFDHVSNGIIKDSFTYGNSVGIEITNSSKNNTVVSCNSTNNIYVGIYVNFDSNIRVEYNFFSYNGGGGDFYSDNLTVDGNIFSFNGLEGISTYGSGSFYNNSVKNNVEGFMVSYNNNFVYNNYISNNKDSGIYVDGYNNTFSNNIIRNNKKSGFSVVGHNNTYSNNIVLYNEYSGFDLQNSFYSTFQYNSIEYSKYGFYIYKSSNNNITGNLFSHNSENILENKSTHNIFSNNFNTVSNQDLTIFLVSSILSVGFIFINVELRRYTRKKRILTKKEKISLASVKKDPLRFFKKTTQRKSLSKEVLDLLEEIENENKL